MSMGRAYRDAPRAPVILQELPNGLYGLLFQKIRSPISRGDRIFRNKWLAPRWFKQFLIIVSTQTFSLRLLKVRSNNYSIRGWLFLLVMSTNHRHFSLRLLRLLLWSSTGNILIVNSSLNAIVDFPMTILCSCFRSL